MSLPHTFSWPAPYTAAISLSYDDGLSCHHQYVAPELESFNFRGTFYVPVISTLLTETAAWRALAQNGHELGNHSCFHPCRKDEAHDWLHPAYDLKAYDERRWSEEMKAANLCLSLLDGKKPESRSFGNNCNNTIIGPDDAPISLDTLIETLFVAGRGGGPDRSVNVYSPINMSNLGNRVFDLLTIDTCIQYLMQAMNDQDWLIVEMHGVGKGTHNLFVEEHNHRSICQFLQQQPQVWVAPVCEIAAYVRQHARLI